MIGTDKACDFCSCRPVVARHQIDPRSIAPWEDQPARWWYACAECHALILAGDENRLADRAVDHIPALQRMGGDQAYAIAHGSHAQFWNLDAGIWEQLGFE